MTGLDRKIAELNGWREPTPEELADLWKDFPSASVNLCRPISGRRLEFGNAADYSTSDSKALELVDEMPQATFFLERFGRKEKTWRAVFDFREVMVVTPTGVKWFTFDGKAPSRPEAICRAYIAAREWMEKKG